MKSKSIKSTLLFSSLLGILLGISACNSGGTGDSTENLYNVVNTSTVVNENCNQVESGIYNCPIGQHSRLVSTINLKLNPAAFVLIPDTAPTNVVINHVGTCSTTTVESYSCTITIEGNYPAVASTVTMPLTGSLGNQQFIVVNYQ